MGEGVLKAGRRADGLAGSVAARQAALFADAGLERRADGSLLLGHVSLEDISRAAGTPAFVYNAGAVRARFSVLADALAPLDHRICYAVKANGSLAILRVLRDLGAGADIVSVGELRRVLAAGFRPEKIVFSGVGKTRDELAEACAVGIGQINLESLEELETLARVADMQEARIRVGIRVNPDVTLNTHPYLTTGTAAAKFGIPADLVLDTARRVAAHPRLELTGLAMHLGSQLLDTAPYLRGATRLVELVLQVRAAGIGTLRALDIGGGLGIRYKDEEPLAPERLAATIRPLVAGLGVALHLEPGRFLVGSAGVLLATVLYRKHAGGKDFVVVDAGMNDLVRPSHYNAHHEVVVLRDQRRPVQLVDVVGPICETGDFLALERPLPAVEPGERVAILCAGAYGFVMGSTYNARPRPPEVVVEEGRWGLARPRESLEELMHGELVTPLVDEGP